MILEENNGNHILRSDLPPHMTEQASQTERLAQKYNRTDLFWEVGSIVFLMGKLLKRRGFCGRHVAAPNLAVCARKNFKDFPRRERLCERTVEDAGPYNL